MKRIRILQRKLLGKKEQPKIMEYYALLIAALFIWTEFPPFSKINLQVKR